MCTTEIECLQNIEARLQGWHDYAQAQESTYQLLVDVAYNIYSFSLIVAFLLVFLVFVYAFWQFIKFLEY